jgi:site-specific DNA-methyltransferase (adenine-specific)
MAKRKIASQDVLGDQPLTAFGRRLRSQRLEARYSLAELANRVGATKGYLSRLESGKAKPSPDMIQRLAQALGINPTPLQILAGQLPADVKQILYSYPLEAPTVLRETFVSYDSPRGVPQQAVPRSKGGETELGASVLPSGWKGLYQVVHADCLQWLKEREPNSIHAIVTDPPYGLKEYTSGEKQKLRHRRGGVWRIPPTFDGCARSPVPRFTVLTDDDLAALRAFFSEWAKRTLRVLVPGGHVFVATNALVSQFVYTELIRAGFEKRGEIIRLVQTLRGGDRPKNAHEEFTDVTVMPRSCWEPWGLFRKPCEGRVQDNLRKWKTGGLRRVSDEQPFCDVIKSAPTRNVEREIAPHPSLKPQALMRQLVRAALPLGEGVILDPFMGAGSTIAAACAVGYRSIGIESDLEFYELAMKAIPKLATLASNGCNGIGTASNDAARGAQQVLFAP